MSTNAYAIKRAIIADLRDRAAQEGVGALAGVQVLYAFHRTAEAVCVYGGRVEFAHPEDEDLTAGGGQVIHSESAVINLHIRARLTPVPDAGIEESDRVVEGIADAIGAYLATNPRMGGAKVISRIDGGIGDYIEDDDASSSVLSLRLVVQSTVNPSET